MVKVIHNRSLYLLILVGLLFPASNAFADGNTTDFSITVNPSVSLSVSSASVNFEITPTMAGAYNSANFTVTSATNNVYGYTLTMSTNNVNLTSNTVNPNTGTNPTIPTLTETQDGITVAQFEASTDSSVLNHYGVAIGANNYNAMKSSNQVKKTTENNTTADTTTINLASKLDLLTVPGTYSTTLNFQIVANPLPGGLEEAYQNAGKSKKTVGNKSYYSMQDMTPAICNAATVSQELEVVDERDNTIYRINKLADGRCWLLDNLALDPLASGVSITANNTNASAEVIANFLNGSVSALHDGWSTNAVTNVMSANTFTIPQYNIESRNVLPTDDYDEWNDEYYTDPIKDDVIQEKWKVGAYYNFCAASMGTYCYAQNTGIDRNQTSAIDAEYDICPAGWRLPTGGQQPSDGGQTNGGEYEALSYAVFGEKGWILDTTKIETLRRMLKLPLSGDFYSGSADGQGARGTFWSSTHYEETNSYPNDVYFLHISNEEFDPSDSDYAYVGESVRCIAKTGTEPAPSGN